MDGETADELLGILATRHCRPLLAYFRESDAEIASVRDLTTELAARTGNPDEVATRLHHSTLPKLEGAGVIDFEAENGTVRYRGHADLEALAEAVAACRLERAEER